MTQPNFSVIQAQRAEQPVLIMIDTSLNPAADAAAFPWLITVHLPMRDPDSNGLCSQSEAARLDNVEDQILSDLSGQEYRYLGHTTGNGSREVLVYVRDPDTTITKLSEGLLRTGEASIEVQKSHDPNWDYYRQFPR